MPPPQLHMSYDQIPRRSVGGDCCGLGGWSTVYQLDFSAEGSQNLAANGNYNIGGKVWTRQNAAHDQAAMVLTNGTGLVISPDQTSDYQDATRTAPLIWTPLSGLVPSATWNTAFRIWVSSPTDPPLPDPGPNGFIWFAGIDSNSMAYSDVGMRGCVAGQAVQGMLARTTVNSVSSWQIQQFQLGLASRTMCFLVQQGTVTEIVEGSTYSGAEGAVNAWPTPQLLNPRCGSSATYNNAMGAAAPPTTTTLGLVIGAFRANNVNFQAVTIKSLRVDARIIGP